MARVVFRMNEGDGAVTRVVDGISGGDEVVTESGGLGRLGRMKRGDSLDIVAHGSTSTVGDKSAQELAAILLRADLPSGIHIGLVACDSGSGGSPYALALKVELVGQKNLPASVTAVAGEFRRNRNTGAIRVTDESGTTIVPGKQTVNTPWGSRTRNVSPGYKI